MDDRGSEQPPGRQAAPTVVAAAVVIIDDELLLVRHGHGPAGGVWSLPHAQVRGGETLAECVVRAVSDHSGHTDGVCGPFMSWTEQIDDTVGEHRIVMFFRAVLLSQQHSLSEADEIRWTPLHDVSSLRLAEGTAEFLSDQSIIDTVT